MNFDNMFDDLTAMLENSTVADENSQGVSDTASSEERSIRGETDSIMLAEDPIESASFAMLRDTLQKLSAEFRKYDLNMRSYAESAKETQINIEDEYKSKISAANEKRNNAIQSAKARKDEWDKEINEYLTHAQKVDEDFQHELSRAASYAPGDGMLRNPPEGSTIEREAKISLSVLGQESQIMREHRHPDDNDELRNLYAKGRELRKEISDKASALQQAISEQYKVELNNAEEEATSVKVQASEERESRLTSNKNKLNAQNTREGSKLISTVEDELRPFHQEELFGATEQAIPNHDSFQPASAFPLGIRFGYIGYDVTSHMNEPVKKSVIQNGFNFALDRVDDHNYLKVPYGFRFTDSNFSTLLEYDEESKQQAIEFLRSAAMQIFMSVPCGKAWFTFIDPVNRGNTFATFSPLREIDERVVGVRIWSGEHEIEESLARLIEYMEDVIQRCLQGRYKNIIEYNAAAGKNAEPLRFLMIMDYPKRFTQHALEMLESIITGGPQTGIFTIFAGEKNDLHGGASGPIVERISSKLNFISYENGAFYTSDVVKEGNLRFFLAPHVPDSKQLDTIKALQRGVKEAEKIIIDYDDVSGGLYQHPERWFSYNAQNGISSPFALGGANRPVALQLGKTGPGYHAMVTGNIGSGKSYLLHAVIMSTLMRYDPADVQFYLLDFKEGVEFKRYADARLANFRVVAIDAEPEFGLAVLQDINREMELRGKQLRDMRVEHIEQYQEIFRSRGEDHKMPRIVVVLDEFQALFTDPDSELCKECARLLERIVLMAGNAMGIHMLLSTQDLSNVKGLPTPVYRQFVTRIAMKSDEEAGKLILSADNEAVKQLITFDPGQAVFNDAVGDRDHNQTIRVAYIQTKECVQMLHDIHDAQQSLVDLNLPEPRLLLSSVQDDPHSELNLFATTGKASDRMGDPSYRLQLGESLAMRNDFYPSLSNSFGQNLLLASDKEKEGKARMAFAFAAMSIIYETIRLEGTISRPIITLFDFPGTTTLNSSNDLLGRLCQEIPEAFRIFRKEDVLEGVRILAEELNDGQQQFVFFFALNRARRLLSGATSYQEKPRDVLARLIRNGPEKGMNFIVWVNDPMMYLDDYGDTLDSFSYRLGFNMDETGYKAILKQGLPKSEGELNAISYDENDDNSKVRLYSAPTDRWVDDFIQRCRSYIGKIGDTQEPMFL